MIYSFNQNGILSDALIFQYHMGSDIYSNVNIHVPENRENLDATLALHDVYSLNVVIKNLINKKILKDIQSHAEPCRTMPNHAEPYGKCHTFEYKHLTNPWDNLIAASGRHLNYRQCMLIQ